MKDIKIIVDRKTSMVDLDNHMLGNDGENLQGDIIFSFANDFVDGQARLEYEIETEKKYLFLTKDEETYKIPIKSVLTKFGAINMQLVITEGTFEEEIPIFKSNVFCVYVSESINAEIEQPEEYLSWIEIANTKLNEFEEGLIKIETQSSYAKEQGDYANEQGRFAKEQGENVQNDIEEIRNVVDEANENSDTAISIAKGANQALDYLNYESMIINFNAFEKEKFSTGQNVMIKKLNVPDMWIYQLSEEYKSYTYTNDEEVINLLLSDSGFHVGYYILSALETQKVDLTEYVKNTDYATTTKPGIVKVPTWSGLTVSASNIWLKEATDAQIQAKNETYIPITCSKVDVAVKYGLTENKLVLTETQKTKACNWLGTAKQVVLTQTEYDALETKDEDTYYNIVEE